MGTSGTDVARDLGDVVLLDDNLASLVAAIEQGRTTHTNVRKALNFLLAANLSEILVTIGAIALGVARPLSAVQCLWINLLSDVLPALALAVEPAERDVMREEPRDRDAPILSSRTLRGAGARRGSWPRRPWGHVGSRRRGMAWASRPRRWPSPR